MTSSVSGSFLLVIKEPAKRMLACIDIVNPVIYLTGNSNIRRSQKFSKVSRDTDRGKSEEIVQGLTEAAEFLKVALKKRLKVRWIGRQPLYTDSTILAAP